MKRIVLASAGAILCVAVLAGVVVSTRGAGSTTRVALPPIDTLRNGDLIFRAGVSGNSQLIKVFDPGAEYTHVGMVDVRDGNAYVVHIEPGASDGKVQREALADFLAPGKADAYAIFNVTSAADARGRQAIKAALDYGERDVTFDHDFDLDTLDQMYCTELVWRAYLTTGLDLLDGDFGALSSVSGKRLIRITGLSHSRQIRPSQASRPAE
jgi:hypothetical protein